MSFPRGRGGLARVAATAAAGFALQNATPTILEWTTPDDGQIHAISTFAALNVTAATTGGALAWVLEIDGVSTQQPVFNAGLGVALYQGSNGYPSGYEVGPNTTVKLLQTSAMTAGAARLYAEIWAS